MAAESLCLGQINKQIIYIQSETKYLKLMENNI